MRKVQKTFLFFAILLFWGGNMLNAQQVADSLFYNTVSTAILNSDVESLTSYVHTKVDITLLGKSGIYSKNQSKFILTSFFEKNKPIAFRIVNKNKVDRSSFCVGKMHTRQKHFEVCFLTKRIKNKIFIYQIRIEE